MSERRMPSQKIVVATARELVGFLWAVLAAPQRVAETKASPKARVYRLKKRTPATVRPQLASR